MFDQRHKDLLDESQKLFSNRSGLLNFWQEVADNFYPERATFTVSRSFSEEFADHLTTSYPLVARRELGNQFGAMLRPQDSEWFFIKAAREDRMGEDDVEGRQFLEWATGLQRRAMYDKDSGFVRATKEGDHDFAAFGQCAISIELNRNLDGLLYQTWHLRDMAWKDGYNGKVSAIHRKFKPSLAVLKETFGEAKLTQRARERLKENRLEEVTCRHFVIPSDEYEGKWRTPYVSIYLDLTNEEVIEEVGSWTPRYVIPRWQTVSGSQYAYSPAAVAALPDGRLIQAMTLTLLEAGEKASDPPMVATQEVVKSNVDTRAGGVTWVDSEYDERLGEALRALSIDRSGLQFGVEMHDRVRVALAEAFYLNKLNLPPAGTGDMTAFETAQRIQEYIRNALPIFEPMETDYNGEMCEQTFELLLHGGAFGRPEDIPESLAGEDVTFRFESPLTEMVERAKGQEFLEARNMTMAAAEFDPSAGPILDAATALRDVLKGIGTSARWIRTEDDVDAILQQRQQALEARAMLGVMKEGAGAAKDIGQAAASGAQAADMLVGEAEAA